MLGLLPEGALYVQPTHEVFSPWAVTRPLVLDLGLVQRVECFRQLRCGTFLAVRLVPQTRLRNHQVGQRRESTVKT